MDAYQESRVSVSRRSLQGEGIDIRALAATTRGICIPAVCVRGVCAVSSDGHPPLLPIVMTIDVAVSAVRFERIAVMKRDAFGAIERGVARWSDGTAASAVRRDTRSGWWWLRPVARRLLRQEIAALRAAQGVAGIPDLIAASRTELLRTWIDGHPMSESPPHDVAWFAQARMLLAALHARGVAHNDLHKEPNWIVVDATTPAIVDFQLAHVSARRGRIFASMARADLRYLLKHQKRHCPGTLTDAELAQVARPNWLSRWWRRTLKRAYNLITRRVLRWSDGEGRGRRRGAA